MAPLTAAEIQSHPEFPHAYWDLKATKKDTIDVASGRGGPLKLAYEIHGHGPRKIVFIMGLGGHMNTWMRQLKDFGHTEAEKYTTLVFDNRGMGESGKPLLRYTTSEMAKDLVELLDHVGWTEDRSVHVVGISMGGMIAQELGMLIPERICSLNLISTAPRITRTKPFLENVRNRINLMIPKAIDVQIAHVKADCYSAEWLARPDETEPTVQPFPTNGDRFAAAEISFHHKSAAQLKHLGDSVGRERILVFHGTRDEMIQFVHAEMLLRELGGEEGGVTKSFHEGLGHVGPVEIRKEFNEIIRSRIEKTESMVAK